MTRLREKLSSNAVKVETKKDNEEPEEEEEEAKKRKEMQQQDSALYSADLKY